MRNNILKHQMRDNILKHQIRATYNAHDNICGAVEHHLDSLHGTVYRVARHADRAAKKLSDLFDMWLMPINTMAMMYQEGLKEKVTETFEAWSLDDNENELYNVLPDGGKALRERAAAGLVKIRAIIFRRHVES